MYKELGARLSRARQAAKITQEDLARAVGLSRTSITNIEKGRQPVQIHVLIRLADALGVSVGDLLPLRAAPSGPPNSSKLRALDPEKRAWAERVMGPAHSADQER